MNILLIEPAFPFPSKSKHSANEVHKNFVPIGLLKLGAYYKSAGHRTKLIRGCKTVGELRGFCPDKILITSLFTYWSMYVWDLVRHFRTIFPRAEIVIGGIYATLHCKSDEFKKLARLYDASYHDGLHAEAEKFLPDYSLLRGKINYHATHAMRGCIRRCKFCGTWRLESQRTFKDAEQLVAEIVKAKKNRVIFYDNNFLANPYIEEILSKLAVLKVNNKPIIYESQSGFDGRLLELNPGLALLLKKAKFQNIRIAWDNSIKDTPKIKKQISILKKAGYIAKDTSVFMIYNFEPSYKEMLKKVDCCAKWGVQIADCRFRPLDVIFDNYNSGKHKYGQTEKDYYIHTKNDWTDQKIRDFRKRVRRHNIWIRYARDKGGEYDKKMEKWSAIHNVYKFFSLGRPPQIEKIDKSEVRQKRIRLMNKVKNYCIKNKVSAPNLNSCSSKDVDIILNNFLAKTICAPS